MTRRAALPAAGQHGVPELRAVPAPRRVRERRLRPARGAGRQGRGARRGSPRPSGWCSSRAASARGRASSRAASSSGWRWPGRWSTAPRCCCWTSRWARSTSSFAPSMQSQLKDLQRSVGVTFCYVTHDQGEAFSMSDRVAVMNLGLLEQLGTPEDIYHRPAHAVRGRLRRQGQPLPRAGRERRTGRLLGRHRRRRHSAGVPGPDGLADRRRGGRWWCGPRTCAWHRRGRRRPRRHRRRRRIPGGGADGAAAVVRGWGS